MNRIVLINRALVRIGAVPLATEFDAAAQAPLAIYASVVEHLSSLPFSFLKSKRRLFRKTAPPDPPQWKHAFQLPPDRLGPPRAVYADKDARKPTTAYDLQGDELLADDPEIWAIVSADTDPNRWPGDFRELVMTALMAEMALSIREDRGLYDRLDAKAFGTPGQGRRGGMVAACLETDSQAIPSTMVGAQDNPLIDARW